MLSLDRDATGYQALGDDDPVIARLLEAAPGLRPPLFYSPYEAALWAVISMRRPRPTAERWRSRLSEAAGARFEVAGREMWAVPTPERLAELGVEGVVSAAGIEPARAERVVGVATAALAGTLDAAAIAAHSEDDARAALRTIPGIGPFYADLILIRASGVTDVLPLNEPRLLALMGELYAPGRSGDAQGGAAAGRALAPLEDVGGGPVPRRRPPAPGSGRPPPRPDRGRPPFVGPTSTHPLGGRGAAPRSSTVTRRRTLRSASPGRLPPPAGSVSKVNVENVV